MLEKRSCRSIPGQLRGRALLPGTASRLTGGSGYRQLDQADIPRQQGLVLQQAVQEVMGQFFHGGVAQRQQQGVTFQQQHHILVMADPVVFALLFYLEIGGLGGDKGVFVQAVAQRFQPPFVTGVIVREAIVIHRRHNAGGNREVVPVQALSLGGGKNGEMGGRELVAFLVDMNGGQSFGHRV